MNTTTYMLLRMCARGDKQLEFINEVIENRGVIKLYEVKRPIAGVGMREIIVQGRTNLPGKSWTGLRKRLVQAGFTCHRDVNKMELIIGLGAHSL